MTAGEPVPRAVPLAPKIVNEVHELHERSASLVREASGLRGRRNRRERKEARDAENDLLRVLGFDSYAAFAAAVDPPVGLQAPELSLVEVDVVHVTESEGQSDDRSLEDRALDEVVREARQTEAALLRVLSDDGRRSVPGVEARVGSGADAPADLVADLHARVSAFEEEMAETRFELHRVRDELRGRTVGAGPDTAPSDGAAHDVSVQAAAVALAQVAAEMRSLCELLREERAAVAALATTARAQAELVLDAARLDAQAVRDAAAADARAVLDQARADAVALTRNAISTVDGLRQLAAEERGDAEPTR